MKTLHVRRWKISIGDTLRVLRRLPDASVHCCVTSPPYWGLRDYGVEGQIGLEPTPAAYVEKMVAVFREVRRVLRDDGTLWLNLGDSYCSNFGMGAKRDSSWWSSRSGDLEGKGWGSVETAIPPNAFRAGRPDKLKVKDLVGIPWRVAFALQADGWYLRSDIIWAKPNPMPESVTDRPTKAHEYVFLLSKKQSYYYDAEAVAEAATCAGKTVRYTEASKNARSKSDPRFATRPSTDMIVKKTRNRRTVWTIAPKPFKGAHFAVMPTELARLCVTAGTPAGGIVLDPFCGAGTTGCAALPEGRRFYGIDLNPTYVREVAAPRLRNVAAETTGPDSPPPPSRKKP